MSGHPWTKWYWADWRSDPCLRMCSFAARGLWAEMLALMQEANPYGHLVVNNVVPTDAQLAVLAGAHSEQVPDLIRELETAGVFSRTRKGVIYSRRMVRDEKKAETARSNGKNGGNPTLREQTTIFELDNPQDKGGDKPQKPEARSQKPERDANASQRARFEEFYSVFPRKKGKEAAWKAYQRAEKTAKPEEITAGAASYAREKRATEPQFLKHPATWLNAACWNDEPDLLKPKYTGGFVPLGVGG